KSPSAIQNLYMAHGSNPASSGYGIYVVPSGNVGIGTANPAYKLDVAGDIRFTGTLQGGTVPWSRLSNVPSTFPPSSHTHAASDITSGTLPVARGGTGLSSLTAGNYLRAASSSAFEQRTPAQVRSDIGAAPASHTHAWGDITGKPS